MSTTQSFNFEHNKLDNFEYLEQEMNYCSYHDELIHEISCTYPGIGKIVNGQLTRKYFFLMKACQCEFLTNLTFFLGQFCRTLHIPLPSPSSNSGVADINTKDACKSTAVHFKSVYNRDRLVLGFN